MKVSSVLILVALAIPNSLANQCGDYCEATLDLVNAQRAKLGLKSLCWNEKLSISAQAHSEDQALQSKMTHDGSDGCNLPCRVDRVGYTWSYVSENVAWGYTTPKAVFTAWMNSDSHRKNIENPKAENYGFGLHAYYWTQNFGNPISEPNNGCDSGGTDAPCSPNPCQNSGVCSTSGSTFSCACADGYGGSDCSEDFCLGYCQNSGTCQRIAGGAKCACADGYGGSDCSEDFCLGYCQNSGTCQRIAGGAKCACADGFSGDRCETPPATSSEAVDPCSADPCLHGGSCTSVGEAVTCQCLEGYSGSRCESAQLVSCADNPCFHGGYCVESGEEIECQCLLGFKGLLCESVDPDAIRNATLPYTDAAAGHGRSSLTAAVVALAGILVMVMLV